jgi:hypothetical protein
MELVANADENKVRQLTGRIVPEHNGSAGTGAALDSLAFTIIELAHLDHMPRR